MQDSNKNWVYIYGKVRKSSKGKCKSRVLRGGEKEVWESAHNANKKRGNLINLKFFF